MAACPLSFGWRAALVAAAGLAITAAAVAVWGFGTLLPAPPISVTDPGTLTLAHGALPAGATVALLPPDPSTAGATPLPLALSGRFARPMRPGGPPRHEWPAVHALARFEGTAVTVAFDDDENRYRLGLDGSDLSLVIDRPGQSDLRILGLPGGPHELRLEKISESPAPRPFPLLYAGPGTQPLPPPEPGRQIEVIGDSESVGYGIAAPRRDCTAEEQFATTDSSLGFGPILAAALDADYRLVARSGMGLVRNYGGADAGRSLTALYPLALPSDPEAPALPVAWSPRLVVLQLGTNDVIDSPEPHLPDGYAEAAETFLHDLRRANPGATILVLLTTDPDAGRADALAPVIASLSAESGAPVALVQGPHSALTGCHWHPSLADHAAIATALRDALADLPDPWAAPAP